MTSTPLDCCLWPTCAANPGSAIFCATHLPMVPTAHLDRLNHAVYTGDLGLWRETVVRLREEVWHQ